MNSFPEGSAVVYCQGFFNTPNGKTAHGLVRRTLRYKVHSVIDSRYSGCDAAEVLDGVARGIPVFADLTSALKAKRLETSPGYFVIGLAPDGGRLPSDARESVLDAIQNGLNVDSGLHDYLSEDVEIMALAERFKTRIRDVRKPPHRNDLHFFSGKIEAVESLKIAVLGTDSAVGKRTTAWIIHDSLRRQGYSSELVGTGQTAWMQGARYAIVIDSLVSDFVAGEIEHVVWSAWNDSRPDVILIEGQGSLMNPAYPGGFEILAAGRPDVIVLQHAPARLEYDGFPGYPLHPLETQIKAIELISGRPVVAITVNHEGIDRDDVTGVCESIRAQTGLPAFDVLLNGADELASLIADHRKVR